MDHVHKFEAFAPGKKVCACGARLAVHVSDGRGGEMLRGQDVTWAHQRVIMTPEKVST